MSEHPAGPVERRTRSPLWWTDQFGYVAQIDGKYFVAWVGPSIKNLPADAVELRPVSAPPAAACTHTEHEDWTGRPVRMGVVRDERGWARWERCPAPAATEAEPHVYMSTSCLHGEHGYCQSDTSAAGGKVPAQCKFCAAPCICGCHKSVSVTGREPVRAEHKGVAELVEAWRSAADDQGGNHYREGYGDALHRAADELATALDHVTVPAPVDADRLDRDARAAWRAYFGRYPIRGWDELHAEHREAWGATACAVAAELGVPVPDTETED